MSRGAGSATSFGLLQVLERRRHLLLDRHRAHVAILKGPELLRVEARGRFVDAIEREQIDHLAASEVLSRVVERPAQQQQVIDDRVRQVTRDAIEIDDDGIERLGRRRMADLGRDVERVVVEPLEVGLLQVLSDLAFAELVLAAGLRDIRQMRELRQPVAQAFEDEDLSRCVREMLDRANHVRDLEVVIVDCAREMIEARAVRALHDVVLLVGPIERDVAADQVVEAALTLARHLESHHALAPLRLEALRVPVGLGHETTAVQKRALVLFRRRALGLDLFGRRIVAIRAAGFEQTCDRGPVSLVTLRLEVRRVRSADLRALVPVETEPTEPVEDRLQGFRDIALLIRVVDAEQELPAVLAREQPIEQSGANAAYMQVARGAWSETSAYRHADLSRRAAQCTGFRSEVH